MEKVSAPIRLDPGEPGRLIVRLTYTPERVARIKTVDGHRGVLNPADRLGLDCSA